MPQSDFYNHNRFIAYPLRAQSKSEFVFGGMVMRESALLDAGFVLGIDSGYDPAYRVNLLSVAVSGTSVTFVCKDYTETATFTFVCDSTDPEGTLYEVDADEGSGSGTGWLVPGDLGTLVAEAGDGVYTKAGGYSFEPALVQTLHKHFVKQINIASQPDTVWHPPEECGGAATDLWRYIVTGAGLTGAQKFRAGYNARIAVVDSGNYIEIAAGRGRGEGEPCDRVDIGEPLSEGPGCADIFNTIAGILPDEQGNFTLKALSSGIKITPYPDDHKVIISFGSGDELYCSV